ncbi:hypothetical protein [uncultured Friedmanniella sp.]|uniref:hypothetical protein n=1 Tax=uncultured Friedmanniella sp. TaxID=335381 RepID=UPI0035CC1888
MSILDDNTDPRTTNAAKCGNPEPALPACPAWCTHDQPNQPKIDHTYLDEDAAGWPMRKHTIEYPLVEASRDHRPDTPVLPDVFVCLMQAESATPDGLHRGQFEIGLAADEFPHLTAGEARQVAAHLIAAADELDELTDGIK